jgi:hypothetical protein
VPYPVDFFLYDSRIALDFTSAEFATAWPHPAVVKQQYAYWPSGGHVHSYRHATDILTIVGDALAHSQKLHSADFQCVNVDFGTVTSSAQTSTFSDHRTIGLGPGEYACYNPVSYSWCNADPPRCGQVPEVIVSDSSVSVRWHSTAGHYDQDHP